MHTNGDEVQVMTQQLQELRLPVGTRKEGRIELCHCGGDLAISLPNGFIAERLHKLQQVQLQVLTGCFLKNGHSVASNLLHVTAILAKQRERIGNVHRTPFCKTCDLLLALLRVIPVHGRPCEEPMRQTPQR